LASRMIQCILRKGRLEMGLLDLAGSLFGGPQQGGGLMQVILGLVNEQGGLPGLINRLQASGLGEQARSWVGTGENLPVSPEQIQGLLGGDKLRVLAAQLGMNHQDAAHGLAELLPKAVDRMTPGGQVPAEGQDLMGLLKGFLD
jgi:uncharacterized protein YidB (DUF937 family)